MDIETLIIDGVPIAHLGGAGARIASAEQALDLIMDVKYAAGAERVAVDKQAMPAEFFILSSGMAGEILQKFVTYGIRAAFYGDFTRYTSKPLQDFIRESNRGRQVCFLPTKEEALARLAAL